MQISAPAGVPRERCSSRRSYCKAAMHFIANRKSARRQCGPEARPPLFNHFQNAQGQALRTQSAANFRVFLIGTILRIYLQCTISYT